MNEIIKGTREQN